MMARRLISIVLTAILVLPSLYVPTLSMGPGAHSSTSTTPDPFGWGTDKISFISVCTSGCTGTWPHVYTITHYNRASGVFSGTGVGLNDSATEVIRGTITPSGNLTLHSVYTKWSYSYDVTATRAGDGTFSGTLISSQNQRSTVTLSPPKASTGSDATPNAMTTARAVHTATLLPNGKVLVAGGIDASGHAVSSAELYDPTTGIWTATGNMTMARWQHTATLLADGKVLVVGGIDTTASNTTVLSSAELYDPHTGRWTATGSMHNARGSHVALLLSTGRVLVIGGWCNKEQTCILNSAELYDPHTGIWTPTSAMETARALPTATLLVDGRVLVAGGDSTCCQYTAFASAELYDPRTASWSPTGSMHTSRLAHTATRLPNGSVLVVGGFSGVSPNQASVSSAEIYNPSSGTWTETGAMSESRMALTATLLPDGRVLAAGGDNCSASTSCTPLASTELYNPVTGIWASAADMSVARWTHTATLLPNGQVLIIGGNTLSCCAWSGMTSTELYSSSTSGPSPTPSPPLAPPDSGSGSCPQPWTCADIGHPASPGDQRFADGTWTISGGGADIWGSSDQFHYVWQPVEGDGFITARITSQTLPDISSKAGVMLRQDTDPDAPNYYFLVSSHDVGVAYRAVRGGDSAVLLRLPHVLPSYLGVRRQGNTFTAYTSSDGKAWSRVPGSTMTISMGTTALAGLAVTAHNDGALSTATFDHVSIQSTAPGPSPDHDNVVTAYRRLRDTVKASMKADLYAFASLEAQFYVTMRPTSQTYATTAWSLLSAPTQDLVAESATLGRDYPYLLKLAGLIDKADNVNNIAAGLASVIHQSPPNATQDEIATYIYDHFYNQVNLGGTTPGLAGLLRDVDTETTRIVNNLPNPFPTDPYARGPYDDYTYYALEIMNAQIAELSSSMQQPALVYDVSCSAVELGVLQEDATYMNSAAGVVDRAGNVTLATIVTTIAAGAAFGGSLLAKVTDTAAIIPTEGAAAIALPPLEGALWTSAGNFSRIVSAIGTTSAVANLTGQGAMALDGLHAQAQLSSDLRVRMRLLRNVGDELSSFFPSEALHTPTSTTTHATNILRAEAVAGSANDGGAPRLVAVVTVASPNVVVRGDAMGGEGIGLVTVRNAETHPITVTLWATVAADEAGGTVPVSLAGSSPTMISAGGRKTIGLSYTVLRSSYIGNGGYSLLTSVGAVDPTGAIRIQGPFTSHFYAGTPQELTILTRQQVRTIASGNLNKNQVHTTTIRFPPFTRHGRLLLSFPDGSDMDLHVYDAQGKHAGVNYSSHRVDAQIPGIAYSGPNAHPQWLELHNPGSKRYVIKVVGRSIAAGSHFDLSSLSTPALPGILTASSDADWSISIPTTRKTTTAFDVPVMESGGSADITGVHVKVSAFANSVGSRVRAFRISARVPSAIKAGQRVLVRVRVTIMPDIRVGTYHGTVTINGYDPSRHRLESSTRVTLIVWRTPTHRPSPLRRRQAVRVKTTR